MRVGPGMWRNGLDRLLQLSNNRVFRWAAGSAVALLFVAFVGYRFSGDWRRLAATEVSIRGDYVIVAGALYGFNFVLFLLAWQGIVTTLGGSADWRTNALIYCYTYLARLLPTSVWFFASRFRFSPQIGLTGKHGLYATGLELGLHAFIGLCFYAFLQLIQSQRWIYMVLLVLVLAIAWRLGWLRWTVFPGARAVRLHELALWSLLYLLTWIVAGPYLQAIIRAFVPSSISIWSAWNAWTLAGLAGYVGFFLLGGTGLLRELSLSVLLASYLLGGDALIIAIGSRLILTGSTILWALLVIAVIRVASSPRIAKRSERTRQDG